MIRFILAGALGAIALIVYLLFRRLRQLSWQLTQLRVERDSERILREIGIRTGSRHIEAIPTDAPARRKGHLSLYIGGGLASAVMRLRDTCHAHRPALVTSGAAATVAIGAAALLLSTNLNQPPPGVTGPAEPPTQAASHAPSTPGKQPSRGSAPPSQPPGPSSSLRTPTGDTEDSPEAVANIVTPLQPPRAPEDSSTSPPARSSPSGGRPASTMPQPTEPSAPDPSGLSSPTSVPLLCVDARGLLKLRLCLRD